MKSANTSGDSEPKTLEEQHIKKIVVPPKSPKLTKKSVSLIKKLKLKKSNPSKSQTENLPGTSSQAVERQTPEGDDNFVLTKSASDTNLQNTFKSSEDLSEDNSFCYTGSERESNQYNLAGELKGVPERTKSLEDLKKMPAYGELILDPSADLSNANQSVIKPKDHLYKILVIGDLGTGKTSIIKRYVHRFFTQHYRATIGVDFALKVLNWDDNTLIRLQLWDIAGQERMGNMTRVYYKEAVGAFIVFDVTRPNTFESVANWKSDLDSKVQLPDGSSIPCVLLANKCDQPKEGISNNPNKMNEYCAKNGFTSWFETSARLDVNIDEAARALVQKILLYDSLLNINATRQGEQFSLSKDSNASKSCSC